MGLKAMSWAYTTERPPNERFVLVTLADHADDAGVCWPGIARLAERTGLGRRTIIRALERLQADGVVSVQERYIPGGRQTSNLYVLNLEWRPVHVPAGSKPDAGVADPHGTQGEGVTVTPLRNVPEWHGGGCHGDTPRGATVTPLESSFNPQKKPPCPNSRSDGGDFALQQDGKGDSGAGGSQNPAGSEATAGNQPPAPDEAGEDLRLARWIFALVLGLHPKHRPPNFDKWARDIRLMRERDARARHDIAELFRWANRHPFWQANILSPAKLREKWDTLVIRRQTDAATPGKGLSAPPMQADRRCAFREHGHRCERAGVTSVGVHASSPWYCADHLERVESGDAGDAEVGAHDRAHMGPATGVGVGGLGFGGVTGEGDEGRAQGKATLAAG